SREATHAFEVVLDVLEESGQETQVAGACTSEETCGRPRRQQTGVEEETAEILVGSLDGPLRLVHAERLSAGTPRCGRPGVARMQRGLVVGAVRDRVVQTVAHPRGHPHADGIADQTPPMPGP